MLDFGWASIAARKPLRQQFSGNNGHPAKRKHGNIKTRYNKTYIQNNIYKQSTTYKHTETAGRQQIILQIKKRTQ
jgi:hypothetical protein